MDVADATSSSMLLPSSPPPVTTIEDPAEGKRMEVELFSGCVCSHAAVSLCDVDASDLNEDIRADEQEQVMQQETPKQQQAPSPVQSNGSTDSRTQLQAWKERSTRMEQLLAKKNTKIQEMEETASSLQLYCY
uniref:Uncharacterized protein n=1 Tax=Hyaloperonospora arabidopsidis (strain Emoy2) TaxID=559515 RepID=M4C119_HYAAE